MKRWIVMAGLLMAASAALASTTVRFGNHLVTVGDAEGKVYQVAGKPTRSEPVETVYGGSNGYRLDYDNGPKTIQIFIRNGRVARIEEVD
jgi:hypothetical protein